MKKATLLSCIVLGVTLGSCSQQSAPKDVLSTTYLGRYGVELSSKEWAARGRDGQVVTTLQTGVTVTTSYKGGVQDGDTTYTFPYSESVEHADTYLQGRLIARTYHDESGQPARQERFPASSLRELTVWHRDGSPALVETYRHGQLLSGQYFSKSQQLEASVENGTGTRVRRDLYGELVGTDTFVNGQITKTVAVYPSGDPKEINHYVRGALDGIRQTFYPGGIPKSIESWNHGVQDGITSLFQNGEKIAQIPYINGQRQGIEQRFRGGKLAEEISWENDERQGPTRLFVGDHEATQWYHHGEHVSKATYDRLMARERGHSEEAVVSQ